MLKSLSKLDWGRDPSQQELVDLFYASLNRIYGSQFLKLADLPDELITRQQEIDYSSHSEEDQEKRINEISPTASNPEVTEFKMSPIKPSSEVNSAKRILSEFKEDDQLDSIMEQNSPAKTEQSGSKPNQHSLEELNEQQQQHLNIQQTSIEDFQSKGETVQKIEEIESKESLTQNEIEEGKKDSAEDLGKEADPQGRAGLAQGFTIEEEDEETKSKGSLPEDKVEKPDPIKEVNEAKDENNIETDTKAPEETRITQIIAPMRRHTITQSRFGMYSNRRDSARVKSPSQSSSSSNTSKSEDSQSDANSEKSDESKESGRNRPDMRKPTLLSLGSRADSRRRGNTEIMHGSLKLLPAAQSKQEVSSESEESEEGSSFSQDEDLDFNSIEFLNTFSENALNVLVKATLRRLPYKVSASIVKEKVICFDMGLFEADRDELNTDAYQASFDLLSLRDEDSLDKFGRYLQKNLRDYLSLNKPGFLIFNDKTIKLNQIGMDLSRLLLDLQTPHQNLMIASMNQALYAYHLLKFSAYLLNYNVAYLNLSKESASVRDDHSTNYKSHNYAHFINLLSETASFATKDDRTCLFILQIDSLKSNEIPLSKAYNELILTILGDLNTVITCSSIKTCLNDTKIKVLLSMLKKSPIFEQYSDHHLFYILAHKLALKVKFVILTDSEALLCQNMTHNFTSSIQSTSLTEIMMKYFPQMQASFRRVFLQDLKLALGKTDLIDEEIFPLNVNPKVSKYLETFYNYEVHFTELFEREYQFQILPSSKETLLFVDYVHFELTKLLKQRVINFRSSGEGLNNTIKKMKKKCEELKIETDELQKQNVRALEDIENIKINVEQLNLKIQQMHVAIDELKGQLRVCNEYLQGYTNEENTLKSLSSKLQETTNQLITFNLKDYEEEVKYGKFQQSVYFIMYSILFCLIFDIEIKDAKEYEEVKMPQNIQIGRLKVDNVHGYVGEFKKILMDYGQFKNYIISFKASSIDEDKSRIMIEIIENNDLIKSSGNSYKNFD